MIVGDKKVYWSTSKVASHIRSGHCQGASDEEVQQFKQEFVYESPKNLVHKSAITKKFRESFEVERFHLVRAQKVQKTTRHSTRQDSSNKKPKLGMNEEYEGDDLQTTDLEECDVLYEDLESGREVEEEKDDNEKLEIVFLAEGEELEDNKLLKSSKSQSSTSQELSREDKFIQAVYPQFKGKTKLQLIEDILDLKRRNELLQIKAKTYENTINRLLN